MTLSPASHTMMPRFGALQIINSHNEHDYVLYSAKDKNHDADGVYYMTSKIGTSADVGRASQRLAESAGDPDRKYGIFHDFLVLLNRDVLPEKKFEPDDEINDGITYRGDDDQHHNGAQEFAAHRSGMTDRFKNRFNPGNYFYFDQNDHTEDQRQRQRDAARAGWLVVYRREDREGNPQLSVTV